MTEIPFDLSKLSRGDLERIFGCDGLPEELREEAAMLHDLSDPEGPGPVEGVDLSEEWTLTVPSEVYSQIEALLQRKQ